MKDLPTKNEENLDQEIERLRKEVIDLKQEVSVLERRFDFMQDADARIILEQQAILKTIKIFNKIANELLDKEDKPKDSSSPHYQ